MLTNVIKIILNFNCISFGIQCNIIQFYRVRRNKVIPCIVWLISQERSWIFIRKFTRLFVIHIYVQLTNYIILPQQLTKLCYLNRDKSTLYNVRILRLRYWLYCSIYYENKTGHQL